jgi:hypothetical protein
VDEQASLESALEDMERRIGNAISSLNKSLRGLKAAEKAAKTGDLAALHKALDGQRESARVAHADASSLREAWRMSDEAERQYFQDGAFVREVLERALAERLNAAEVDGMLMSYPAVVRVDPARRQVTIDRKPFRQIRPSTLVGHLAAIQRKPPATRPEQFLEALYRAWDYARHRDAGSRLPAQDVRVDELWAVLTVAPGADREYSKQELGRDLYLLERSGVRETRSGARVHFSRSTGTKVRGAITVVGEDGLPVIYSSVGFSTR